MKKNYLILLSFLFLNTLGFSHMNSYSFSQINDIYVPITGGTVLGGTTNNEEFFVNPNFTNGSSTVSKGIGFPIGFNFTFNGVVYDRFGVHTNGWISLGQFSLLTSVDMGSTIPFYTKTPLSDNTSINPPQLRNRISAFGYDLQGQTGSEIRFEVQGTAPGRVLVIQWKNYRQSGQSGQSYNFQIRLVESSNHIYFVYGANTFASSFSNYNASAEVGLGGQSNTDFINRTNATTTNWNTTSAGTLVTDACLLRGTVPNSGLLFWWKPSLLSEDTFVKEAEVICYPNPFTDKINLDHFQNEKTLVKVYDQVGKMVNEIVLEPMQTEITLPNLSKGIYYLEIQSNNKTFKKKLIKE